MMLTFLKKIFNSNNQTVTNTPEETNSPKTINTIQALWRLQKIILDTLDFNLVVKSIVDGLLIELGYLDLGYRIIVLTLIDHERGVLKRISLSNTPEAGKALAASAVPFHDIEIPLSAQDNLLIKAIKENKPFVTHYWPDLFVPVLTKEEALKNQEAAGIKTSMVYPVVVRGKVIGDLIFSMVKDVEDVTADEQDLIRGFTDIVGLAVQDSQLYSQLQETTLSLEKANERLKELDKLKSEFVSVSAHELRTPMTAIKSYLWMALNNKGEKLSEKQQFYVQRGYNSVDRLIRLVNDMLNISRIESGRISIDLQSVDLNILVQEVVDEVMPRAKEVGVTVSIQKNESLPKVLADPDKIKEVLFNLIGNSLKFTPKGGTITIGYHKKGDMVETKVTDTGSGITKEDMPKLFQKFGLLEGSYITNQTSTSLGTGLGLFICRSIIDLHHGEIKAASDGQGKGATFSFTLKEFTESDMQKLKKETTSGKEKVDLIHAQL